MSIFGEFFSALVSPISDYMNTKQKIKAAQRERSDELKHKELDTKLEVIRNGQQSDIEMDNNARKLSGWMDDVSFFAFLIPAILVFYPPMVPHIEAGFKALESMPQWYQYALGLMLAAVWGYRRLVTPLFEVVVKMYSKKFGV